MIVESGDQISPSVARAALARVAEEASRQPMLVRRLARKHQVNSFAFFCLFITAIFPQLSYGLRKVVRKALRGRALSFTSCLGDDNSSPWFLFLLYRQC